MEDRAAVASPRGQLSQVCSPLGGWRRSKPRLSARGSPPSSGAGVVEIALRLHAAPPQCSAAPRVSPFNADSIFRVLSLCLFLEQCQGSCAGGFRRNRAAPFASPEKQPLGEPPDPLRYRAHTRSGRGSEPHRDQSDCERYRAHQPWGPSSSSPPWGPSSSSPPWGPSSSSPEDQGPGSK